MTKATAKADLAFTVERSALLTALASAARVTAGRTTMPILGYALLTAADGRVLVQATDLELGVTVPVPAMVKADGQCTVHARNLHDIVKQLAGDTVTCKLENHRLVITCGRSRYALPTLDAQDYPGLPQPHPTLPVVTIAADVLADMIARVVFATSKDVNRPSMGGVLCVTPEVGTLRLVASDGHRLARIERDVPMASLAGERVIPARGLIETQRLLDAAEGDVRLVFGPSTAFLILGESVLSMRLLEGEFPNVEQVIPKTHARRCVVSASELTGAVKRVSLVNDERSRCIRFNLAHDDLTLSASNSSTGEASEAMAATYDGDDFVIGLNAAYVLDMLSLGSAADQVEIACNENVEPAVLTFADDPRYVFVVMPIRV